MSYIVVDVEADGPAPGLYSMVCFGAVIVSQMDKTFYGKTRPIADSFIPDALAVSGFSRATHNQFDSPAVVMEMFSDWIKTNSAGKHVFISDNPAFD